MYKKEFHYKKIGDDISTQRNNISKNVIIFVLFAVCIGLLVGLIISVTNPEIRTVVVTLPDTTTTTTTADVTTADTSTTTITTTSTTGVTTTSTSTASPTTTTSPVTTVPQNCTLLNYNFNDFAPEVNLANWTTFGNISNTPVTTDQNCVDDFCAQIGTYSTDSMCTQDTGSAGFFQSFVLPSGCSTTISYYYGWGSVDFSGPTTRNEFNVVVQDAGFSTITTLQMFDVIPGVAGPLLYQCNVCDTTCGGVDLSPYFNQTLYIVFSQIGVNAACTGIVVDDVCVQ